MGASSRIQAHSQTLFCVSFCRKNEPLARSPLLLVCVLKGQDNNWWSRHAAATLIVYPATSMHFDVIVMYILHVGQLKFIALTNKATHHNSTFCGIYIEIGNRKRPTNKSKSDDGLVKTSC